jgi:putative ATP-dependent endonuclease of OLD family
MRSLLQTTYLRALRDALAELSAGRGSRLSRILTNHPRLAGQDVDDFDPATIVAGQVALPKTLRGIMHLAEDQIKNNDVIAATRDELNQSYLDPFSVLGDQLIGTVGITKSELREILEKLDLWIDGVGSSDLRINRGLGTNNILFMATELLLLRTDQDDGLPLLCIEEPEAHLHPQMQLLVSDFFEREAAKPSTPAVSADGERPAQARKKRLQVIVTTHSPTLASKIPLEQLVVVHHGRTYPLWHQRMKLDLSDYRYLANFIDATRANLFFARAVLIVEGDAENLALPAIFDVLGYPLAKTGISIVRVGSRGLFRYARIFQGDVAENDLPIRVACIADLDLPDPETAVQSERDEREAVLHADEGGPVRVFPSDQKTFEYDLAYAGFERPLYRALTLAKLHKSRGIPVPVAERSVVLARADEELDKILETSNGNRHSIAKAVYAPLAAGSASKPETAQYFADLLRQAYREGTIDAAGARAILPPYLDAALSWLVSLPEETQ